MNMLTTNSRNLLVATTLLFGICTATGVQAQQQSDKSADKAKQSSQSKNDGQTVVEVPVIVMVPVKVSDDLAMNNGCWVKLYDKDGFQSDSLTLFGPVNLPVMIGPFGFNWEGKVRSLETGPNANLTIYDNRDFRDQNIFIGAGKKVADMSKKMGFLDNFRSMMLSCK